MKNYKKLKKFKVLVGTPHADRKNYCFNEYLDSVKSLTYSHYNVLIVDNSNTRKNYKQINANNVNAVYVNPHAKSNIQYIAESHEVLREETLRGDYDFLLHLESDIFPPANIIEQLLSHQKQVVSACYMIDLGSDSHLMIQEIEPKSDVIKHTTNIKDGNDILHLDGTLKKVYAAGLGCCLIHRSILKKIKFRYEKDTYAHPDTFFALDLHKLQIPQYQDTSILCNHQNSEWINL